MDTSSATVSVGIEAKDLRRRLRKRLERRRPWRSHLGPFLGTGQNGVMSFCLQWYVLDVERWTLSVVSCPLCSGSAAAEAAGPWGCPLSSALRLCFF